MCIGLDVKYPSFLPDLMTIEFSRHIFEKNPKISNLMKNLPVGAEFFHEDRKTDGYDEANSRFSQFCEGAYKRFLHPAYHRQKSGL